MSSFDGRIVIITGASRGIGRALAEHIAERGGLLGLLARDEASLAEVASEIPTEAVAIGCDVTNADQVAAAFRKVAERFGGIDVVVANAGGQLAAQRAETLPVEQWRDMIDLNLTGAYITSRFAYDYLRRSQSGRMIFISSGAAKEPLTRMCAYAAAKAGVEGLARALCIEWAEQGICVNAISPGLIENPASSEIPDKIRARIIKKTPFQRPGDVRDIAEALLFLAGKESAYVTGQVLSVDGGYRLG